MATGIIQKHADGTDSGWIKLSNDETIYTGDIMYRKIGNRVDVCFFGLSVVSEFTPGSSNLDLGTLPTGYRPGNDYPSGVTGRHHVTFPLRVYIGGTVNNNFTYSGTVFDWGTIRLYFDKNLTPTIPTTATINGAVTYLT